MSYRTKSNIRSTLNYNIVSGLYEIKENEIVYSMPLEETRLLKKYYGGVSEWYMALDKDTKDRVTRSGNVPVEKDDFYPDLLPDE